MPASPVLWLSAVDSSHDPAPLSQGLEICSGLFSLPQAPPPNRVSTVGLFRPHISPCQLPGYLCPTQVLVISYLYLLLSHPVDSLSNLLPDCNWRDLRFPITFFHCSKFWGSLLALWWESSFLHGLQGPIMTQSLCVIWQLSHSPGNLFMVLQLPDHGGLQLLLTTVCFLCHFPQ